MFDVRHFRFAVAAGSGLNEVDEGSYLMSLIRSKWLAVLFGMLLASPALAQKPLPKEEDFYKLTALPIPEGVVLEAGGLELLPDGKLAVSTRRGDIYLVDKPAAENLSDITFKQFASGLHEVLGLAYK